jgi:predicted GIY-YIG superfamily endonuclease
MRYVYVLENAHAQRYIGSTDDLRRRLAEHRAGNCRTTRGRGPWNLIVAVALPDEARARAFERYLKSGSGHAFAKRHFG